MGKRLVSDAKRERGGAAHRSGHVAEVWGALWLMAHGWRILGINVDTPAGEVDILARRGGVLAVVEVKRRAALETALEAVTAAQRGRLLRAGALLARGPGREGLAVRLDLLALAPGRWPRHIADAWPQ